MTRRIAYSISVIALASLMSGCASEGSNGIFATGSVAPVAMAEAPKADPACVTLAGQIEQLRKEGTIERLEKTAAGKTATVQVQRTAVAKQAELNKANADFQAKCSTVQARAGQPVIGATPSPATAAVAAAAAPQAKTAVKSAVRAAAATPAGGVTVAAPAAPAKAQ